MIYKRDGDMRNDVMAMLSALTSRTSLANAGTR